MNLFVKGNLVKLKSLKLQQANGDKIVNEILKNCKNLIKLEIREPSITDQHLNRIANKLNKSNDHQFILQELTLPSSVRNKGLFDCFKLFKNLNSLSISNFEPVLDYLDETDLNDLDNQEFINQLKQQLEKLIKLTITCPMGKIFKLKFNLLIIIILSKKNLSFFLGQQSVEQIVRYCPNINELNLEVQEVMYLKPICKLKSLKSLSLHNSPNLPLSFLNEVLPILEKIGHQFNSLSLEQFDVLDLVEINKFCPELNSFSAQWFTLLSFGRSSFRLLGGDSINVFAMAAAQALNNINSNNTDQLILKRKKKLKDGFSNLRLLRLRPRLNRNLSSLAIEYIIRDAKELQYLELYCCKQFNDALFAHWFELNGFKELKYLIIRHCNDLNRATVARLLCKSPLMYLELDKPLLSKTELFPNSDDPIDLPIVI